MQRFVARPNEALLIARALVPRKWIEVELGVDVFATLDANRSRDFMNYYPHFGNICIDLLL
jgi:hypothetical protein